MIFIHTLGITQQDFQRKYPTNLVDMNVVDNWTKFSLVTKNYLLIRTTSIIDHPLISNQTTKITIDEFLVKYIGK